MVPCNEAYGVLFCSNHAYEVRREHFFPCQSDEFVSHALVCNGHVDCKSGDDESKCNCSDATNRNQSWCIVSKFLSLSSSSDREKFSSSKKLPILEHGTTPCKDGSIIPDKYTNDGFPDCLEDEDEAEHKESILKHSLSHIFCKTTTDIPCYEGYSKCFTVQKLCLLETDNQGKLTTCRNGQHLHQCEEFTCNATFKCPDAHCIPHRYQCDGKWDCIQGEDETECHGSHQKCVQLFRCTKTIICIHVKDVCDDKYDCPNKDDEKLCERKGVSCPFQCACFNLAVSCQEALFDMSFTHIHLQFADISGLTVQRLSNAIVIVLTNCNLQSFCVKKKLDLKELKVLQIMTGVLSKVHTHCLQGLTNTKAITLKCLEIEDIEDFAFSDQLQLVTLDISNNSISHLAADVFHNLSALKQLIVVQNPIETIEINLFLHLESISKIETDYFAICCDVREEHSKECTAHAEWPFSCEDILTLGMKTVVWIIALLVGCFNIACISLSKFLVKTMSHYQILVLFVNISDLICGAYLFVILSADSYYEGKFYTRELFWRTHFLCHTAAAMSLLFTVLSPSMLLFFTVSRFLVIKDPMNPDHKDVSQCKRHCVRIHVASVVFAVASWVVYFAAEGEKSFCVPTCALMGDFKNSILVKVSTGSISALFSLSCFAIITIYALLFKELKATRQTVGKHMDKKDRRMKTQIIILTSINVCCWLPSSVIFFLSLVLAQYPTDMLYWTTMAVMPLNSLLNPAVMTYTEIQKKRRQRHKAPK